MEEEADTAERAGEYGILLTLTAGGSEESVIEDDPGVTVAVGGATADTTSAVADKAGAGGCHGARSKVRERVAGQRENLAKESSGVGGEEGGARSTDWLVNPPELGAKEGGPRPVGWRENPGGTAREWEGGSSRHRALTPPDWASYPGGKKPL